MSNDNLPKGEVESKELLELAAICYANLPFGVQGVTNKSSFMHGFCKGVANKYFLPTTPPASAEGGEDYQSRVNDWMQVCFGLEVSKDVTERNHRFIEEALELVQSTGATQSECHQLVDYVFNRRKGEIIQEVGGVMVTLAALCNAIVLNMEDAGEIELKRIWTKVDKIREKQAAKPKHTPLPSHPSPPQQSGMDAVAFAEWIIQEGYKWSAKHIGKWWRYTKGSVVYYTTAELYTIANPSGQPDKT